MKNTKLLFFLGLLAFNFSYANVPTSVCPDGTEQITYCHCVGGNATLVDLVAVCKDSSNSFNLIETIGDSIISLTTAKRSDTSTDVRFTWEAKCDPGDTTCEILGDATVTNLTISKAHFLGKPNGTYTNSLDSSVEFMDCDPLK